VIEVKAGNYSGVRITCAVVGGGQFFNSSSKFVYVEQISTAERVTKVRRRYSQRAILLVVLDGERAEAKLVALGYRDDDADALLPVGEVEGLRRSVDGLSRVVAIELLTAARALDFRRPLEPAAGTGAVVDLLRSNGVQGPGPDRYLSPEIEATVSLVQSGAVLAAVESKIGELQ